MILQSSIYILAAYLIGSIPFGKIIARRFGQIDITQQGSGNIGATNVAREIGIKAGLLTLCLDTLKGFIPVFFFALSTPESGLNSEIWLSAVALSALLGHQFSIFGNFRGGKGVATALGVYLAISPLSCLLAILVFLATVGLWNFVSLGSMAAASAMPLLLAILGRPLPIVVGAIIAALLIIIRHGENIRRLFKGEERRWRKSSARPEYRGADPTLHQNSNK
jgi:glycerol-3-phosphate acyltransferase PlsY